MPSLIPAVCAFTAGVLGVHALPALPPAWQLVAIAVPAVLPWRARGLWAMAILGMVLTVFRAQGVLEARWPAEQHGSERTLTGRIASLPERAGEGWRFLFASREPGVPPLVRAAWYRPDAAVRAAECWRFTLRLRTPHGSLNPGGFDYEAWLFRQGIGATATVRDATRCEEAGGWPVLRVRQYLVHRLRAALGDHPGAGVLVALLVGDRSGITDGDWDVFRVTGTTHLVAISGFNIALIAGVAFFLCRWAWSAWPRLCLVLPAQRAGLLGSALLAGAYSLVAGFEPPVQRAVVMLWIVLAAVWTHRFSESARVLAAGWLAVLVIDPLAVLAPGLWLSFGAVAAIFYVSLNRVRTPGLFHSLVRLQLLVAIALAPLTLFFFQGVSPLAPLVNLAAVPLFAVLTPAALGALAALLLAPAAGAPLVVGCAEVLARFREVLAWTAELPGLWLAASPSGSALVLALLGFALVCAPRGLPLRRLGAICCLPLLMPAGSALRSNLEVAVLDVGQGLAVVVRTPSHALLYDAGPAFEEGFDAGASIVAPYLLRQGVRELDVLMLSHGDRDHGGGVAAVRRLLRVHREIGTPQGEPCHEGTRWVWDGVEFEILNGPAPGRSDNDASCVLRIAAPELSVLLPGDIEARSEARLVRERGARLPSDVLVAPHHGSRTSSTPEFVAAVRPRVVVYGAGWRNHFRHPRPEVVARYAASGARQYVTGASGTVLLATPGLEVHEYRREAARFWNAPAGP